MKSLHRRKTATETRGVLGAPRTDKTIPDDLFDAAQDHLKNDHVLRYFMKKYNLPRTDPRLTDYTFEDMLVEMIADAIEDERLELGVDGRPVRKVVHKGVEITKTGSPVFDAMEEEWADGQSSDRDKIKQKAVEAFPDDDEFPDEVDLLSAIEERMRGSNG